MFGRFADALCKEIRHRADEISDEVNTLYIGGGTPSVLPLHVLKRVFDALEETGHGGPYDEFTVEVNPEDIVDKGEDYIRGLMELGVSRISMGVQSFDDSILRFMNRRHDAATARRAYAMLESAGIINISIDLIFGLPQLSDDQWKQTLDSALHISSKGGPPQHISSYQLSVEPGSMLAKLVERGKWQEASEELCERQYRLLCQALHEAGYRHYEISNFALPGFEARHNSAYWRHIPYAGFGPAAHSLRVCSQTLCAPVAPSHQWLSSGPATAGCSLQKSTGLFAETLSTPTRGWENATSALQAPGDDNSKMLRYIRQWNEPDLQKYMEDPTEIMDGEDLTEEQVVMERVMLALRTCDGMEEEYLRAHCNPVRIDQALASGDLVRIPASPGTPEPDSPGTPGHTVTEADSPGTSGHTVTEPDSPGTLGPTVTEPAGPCSRLRIPEDRFFVSDMIIADLV